MEWVNYHHLLYFWLVAKEGSLQRASGQLRLAQSTVSKQIHQLEETLGHALFEKRGRKLALTETGKMVHRYAEEIFGLGREMLDTLRDRPVGKPLRFSVGVADVVPKFIAERLIAPALKLAQPVQLVCREGSPARLLADLALHELDLVISDAPSGGDLSLRAFNHPLGSSGITFFARPELTHAGAFPECLAEIPLLLPTRTSSMRRHLDQWFSRLGIRPRIAAEFDDAALLDVFGLRGVGAFPAATVTRREVARRYDVKALGQVTGFRESYFAITVERRVKHPAAMAICDAQLASGRTS
ncbi:MAG TPA: transcriptional activator NhaR [Myxococcales bacterium]|nr:transcriptional activator NhaR [Myxococcales bacterium]